MTTINERKVRCDEAARRIGDILSEYHDVVGPVRCKIHDDIDDCHEDSCDLETQRSMVGGWVLIAEHVILDDLDGQYSITILRTPGQLASTSRGLCEIGARQW